MVNPKKEKITTMKPFCLGLLFFFITQTSIAELYNYPTYNSAKKVNFGVKIGLNSALPSIHSFTIDGNPVENKETEYKINKIISVFARFNFEHFFIKPNLTWNQTESNIKGFYSERAISTENPRTNLIVNLKYHSFDAPLLIGYPIIKQGPYQLNLMAGPCIKCYYGNQLEDITNEFSTCVTDNNTTKWGLNLWTGINVSIHKIFFDFSYEYGITSFRPNFISETSASDSQHLVKLNMNELFMNFSVGFMF